MNRQHLHKLVDIIDETDINVVYQVLLKFANYDFPTQDEILAIENARKQHNAGEIYSDEDVWS